MTDFWLIRRTKLHIPMLYRSDGIYRYTAGVNWRALATLLAVVPLNLPGLINAINPKVYVGHYAFFCECCDTHSHAPPLC
jgi:NCS1 family nucleobase:cation symporter-1